MDLVERLKVWAASPEGQQALTNAVQQTNATSKWLEEVQRMRPKDWEFQVTI